MREERFRHYSVFKMSPGISLLGQKRNVNRYGSPISFRHNAKPSQKNCVLHKNSYSFLQNAHFYAFGPQPMERIFQFNQSHHLVRSGFLQIRLRIPPRTSWQPNNLLELRWRGRRCFNIWWRHLQYFTRNVALCQALRIALQVRG
jgi:hypothetical protein